MTQVSAAPPTIRVLSYNIHKGFTAAALKESIQQVHADLVLLQEVVGFHQKRPTETQFEYLADGLWPHNAYGKNAVYTEGHHGNAILSKYPIVQWENEDVSLSRLERRGILHATLDVPGLQEHLHVYCVHLGLFENDRAAQIAKICARTAAKVPPAAPLIIGGDFNDWRQRATAALESKLGLTEAFWSTHGRHARTFPSRLPFFSLDRLYSRGLACNSAHLMSGGVWRKLSDHLPILAEFAAK